MVAWKRCAKALRATAAALGLGLARVASAFVQIPRVALHAMGVVLPVAAGTILLAGGVSVGYRLLHGSGEQGRRVVLTRHGRDGKLLRQVVDVGGPHGENNPLLASAEGLPAPGSLQPLPGVSGPVATTTPAPGASASGAASHEPAEANYLQAQALATMVELDVSPHVEAGWPVVSYCRAGVHALQCHHNDLWLRNRWSQALSHADVCVAPEQAGYFRLAGADAQGCVAVHFPRRGDVHVVVQETMPAQPDFPTFKDLDLQLMSPLWWGGQVLGNLWVPVVGPQTFFPVRYPSFRDEEHEFGVQQRPVDLLTRLVVFTYHGSGESAARVSTLKLNDPEQGFVLLSASATRMLVGGDFRSVGHRPSYGLAQFLPAGPEQRAIADAHWQLFGTSLQQIRRGPPRESEPGRVYSLLPQDGGSFFIGGSFGLNLLGRRPADVGTMPTVSFANVLLWSRAARNWRGLGLLPGGASDDFNQSHVDALALYRDQLYAGGDFAYAGLASETAGLRQLVPGNGWAAYQRQGGGSWERVIPSLQVRADIHAFAVTPAGLYAGGQIVNLEGERRVLLRMNPDGSLRGEGTPLAVEPLVQPGSAPASLRALTAIGNTLYLGGDFNRLSSGAEASDLASFDGTQPSAFDAMGYSQGVNATVRALQAIWVLSVRPVR